MAAMSKTAIVILAAGGSTRLGRPKQLLEFKGRTLIERAVETALAANCEFVTVVLGNNFAEIEARIERFPVRLCRNRSWKSGMASSIRAGIEDLENENINAVVIMLCDQPLIESRHLRLLVEKFERTGKPLVASVYRDICGVPALFAREMFPELLNLEGDRGARRIIERHIGSVEKVPVPEAKFDIDTPADLEKLSEYE
jgi:molybdenum cofactor cytidylyltransferase